MLDIEKLDSNQDFAEPPDISGLTKEWTVQEVSRMLAVLPNSIKALDKEAIQKEFDYESAKINTKRVYASTALKASQQRASLGLTNVDDRKAWVQTQPEVEKAEVEELVAKTNAIIAKSNRTAAENHFTSVRKVANLLESDLPNQQRIKKYQSQ